MLLEQAQSSAEAESANKAASFGLTPAGPRFSTDYNGGVPSVVPTTERPVYPALAGGQQHGAIPVRAPVFRVEREVAEEEDGGMKSAEEEV